MAKNYLLQFFILFQIVVFQAQAFCFFGKVIFYVRNDLPTNSPALTLHCASGSKELGYHDLITGQDFSYDFCASDSALFFCHLWWKEKDIAFEVYNHDWPLDRCYTPEGDICYWEARDDGIYLSTDFPPTSFTKQYSW
ncbi:hypothetical protein PHJA_000950700 [Phtheirospermum japonicum]|uniref:S-protein homolog n=1 Tax=Phtheirospermum japonicum TaxID=374723 RepID=A0A830BKE8_9LAMI|nr:hypothetical protein PHJA_000950700 [Phtheirospermum japonicum]